MISGSNPCAPTYLLLDDIKFSWLLILYQEKELEAQKILFKTSQSAKFSPYNVQ